MQFQNMPFDLTSALVLLMPSILSDMEGVFVYIDDIIIFSKDIMSHFKMLEEVLHRLEREGLKVKVHNCQFLM